VDLKNLFSFWLSLVKNPKEAFAREKDNASFKKALINYLIAILIPILVSFAILLALIFAEPVDAPFLTPIQFIEEILLIIFVLLFAVLFIQAVLFVTGRLLRGKGKFGGKKLFKQQFYLLSLIVIPISLVNLIINFIPVELIGLIIKLVVGLYSFYLTLLVLSQAHSFSLIRAFFTLWWGATLAGLLLFLLLSPGEPFYQTYCFADEFHVDPDTKQIRFTDLLGGDAATKETDSFNLEIKQSEYDSDVFSLKLKNISSEKITVLGSERSTANIFSVNKGSVSWENPEVATLNPSEENTFYLSGHFPVNSDEAMIIIYEEGGQKKARILRCILQDTLKEKQSLPRMYENFLDKVYNIIFRYYA